MIETTAPFDDATPRARIVRIAFGVIDLGAAALIALGVFVGLPERWLPVDMPAATLAVLLALAGVGVLGRTHWAARCARTASSLALALGLTLIALLVSTASYLDGVYGPVGKGGALIMLFVAALALPYLVLFPAAQLLWLGPRGAAPRREA